MIRLPVRTAAVLVAPAARWGSLLAFALALACGPRAHAQQGRLKTYKRNGIEYFEAGRFENAAEALLVYRRYRPDDDEVWYPLAVSHYQLNQLPEALTLFEGILRAGKKAPEEIYLYLGRIQHNRNAFREAADHYKRFLAEVGEGHALYASIVDDIRRAGFGARLGPAAGALDAYSENLGDAVNGPGDEFRPILSPNYPDRMYFTSIREDATGGFRDAEGELDPKRGELHADMYRARVEDGRWVGGEPLSYLLNTPEHDVALDFAMGGRVLVFQRGPTLFSGEVHADTFRADAEQRTLHTPVWRAAPFAARAGDADAVFFRDSVVLFASRRPGGFGGLDLYIAVRRGGTWGEPVNLGPKINSAYDDRAAFLAADGRTLYFSSNRVNASVGGFDVLRARFDDRRLAWEPPRNLGLSINTAGEELNFRLGPSGLEGYYDSSVRNTGRGGRDIFVAYLKEPAREQTEGPRDPLTFYHAQELARQQALAQAEGEPVPGTVDGGATRIPVSLTLAPLTYGTDDQVATPGNIERARSAVQFLEQYPGSRVVVTAHTDDADPEGFRTYFGIKRAERFAEYRVDRGVDAGRIQVMSVGTSYPMAANAHNGQPSPQGRRYNRRLELHVVPAAEYALQVARDDPRVPDYLAQDLFEEYRKLQRGVVFRVQVAELPQRYDEPDWVALPFAAVQRDYAEQTYRYEAGAFASARSARQMAEEYRRRGFSEARAVAYLDGVRLGPADVARFAPQYPELASFSAALDAEGAPE